MRIRGDGEMRKKNKDKIKRVAGMSLTHIILIIIGIAWMYPFIWMISASFKTQSEFFKSRLGLIPEQFTLDNMIRVWEKANFNVYFLNSVIVTAVSVTLVLAMTAASGYVLGRYNFIGKKTLMTIFIASMTIPLVSTIIPTYEVLKGMNLIGTRMGLILAQAGGGHVIFLLLFSQFFRQIPNELEEAARIDGAGFFRTFIQIMMPLAKPVAVTVIIMESIWAWNSFMLPLVLTLNNPASRTLAVGLYAFKGENTVDWPGIAAGGTIAVIPIVLLFIFLQKYFVDGVAGAVKS